jgi:gluconate 5-dehydrogenase
MNLFNLSNKRALITGGTHGLGMAMAEGLAKAGAELVITSTTPSKMESALNHYKSKGYKASGYIFDITDDKLAAKQVELIEANEGAIDILVNNAGIIKREMAVSMPIEDFRRVIEVDLVGAFIMSQLVGKRMIARGGGKIIKRFYLQNGQFIQDPELQTMLLFGVWQVKIWIIAIWIFAHLIN